MHAESLIVYTNGESALQGRCVVWDMNHKERMRYCAAA